MSKHKCMNCDGEIKGELHVVEGGHFCSKKCAIEALTNILINSAKDQAIEWYKECATVYDKKGE